MFRISKRILCFSLSVVLSIPAFSTSFACVVDDHKYKEEFLNLHDKIMNRDNGYFSIEGIPYYSPETLIVEEDVDYGHETTSSVLANYLQLKAMYGFVTGDWDGYNKAWDIVERYAIPNVEEQPAFEDYNPNDCSFYYPEGKITDYPQLVNPKVPPSKDPIFPELKVAYGSSKIYGIHNLIDVDGWYRYNSMVFASTHYSKINTTRRGPEETIWQRIVIPTFTFDEKQKFTDLIYKSESDVLPSPWSYNTSSAGDANIVKAAYYADKWASEQGESSQVDKAIYSASKIGDYLRYSLLDKYMKPIGCKSVDDKSDGKSAFHYLVSYGYSWGGNTKSNGFAWLKGNDVIHQKDQNPLAAYALSSISSMKPKSSNGQSDWKKSTERQVEFLQWLQSFEGPIAGGCTNSWGSNYMIPPVGSSHFYGMTYEAGKEALRSTGNTSFLYQCKSIANLAEYYAQTKDEKAYGILQKWIDWVLTEIIINDDGSFLIPSTIEWTGQPDSWLGWSGYTGNPDLHASITEYSSDLESAAILSRILFTYAYAIYEDDSVDQECRAVAEELLDRIIYYYGDDLGYTKEEQRPDYENIFTSDLCVPEGFSMRNGQGAILKKGCKYIDARPALANDPYWRMVKDSYNSGVSPRFTYHRFSTQCEIAMALFSAEYFWVPHTSTPHVYTPTPTVILKGDINNDGGVNMVDVLFIAKAFGLLEGEIGYEPKCDLNGDKTINMSDVMIVANNFGKTTS